MKVKILSPKTERDYQLFGIYGLFPYVGKIFPVVYGTKHSLYFFVKIENRTYSIINSCCKVISLKNKLK